MVQGKEAYKAKVRFPEDPDVLARTVLVGNMNTQITLEQVRTPESSFDLQIDPHNLNQHLKPSANSQSL